MRTTTIEKLINNTDDGELLDLYTELESGKVPSTSYAHDFCRKVNRMIDDGEISVRQDGFRHIYLPSLRKLVYKEMARRYASHLMCSKGPVTSTVVNTGVAEDDLADDVCKCAFCNGDYEGSDLIPTDLGWLCKDCITALRSRDETVVTYK